MTITAQAVVDRLSSYLGHQISAQELADWAENALMEAELEEEHFDAIRDALARLGVADVRAFGLTWDDCQAILQELGYAARLEIVTV